MNVDVGQLEGEFYDYMHGLGQADEAWSTEVLEFYVSYFVHCERVLDVGCGQGQFIELLRAQGVDAVGIDMDRRMVELCRAKGFDVVEADLFDYLPRHRGQLDGIFSSNLIEHLSAQDAVRFVRMAFDALAPGGVFLAATPNPRSLIVHLNEFWRDATHVRLYSRSLLEFLFSWAGFEAIRSGENPRTAWAPSSAMQTVPELWEELSARRRRVLWNVSLPKMPAPAPEPPEGPFWRRMAFSLRRRLARFLAETVLFEEFSTFTVLFSNFATLNRALADRFAELVGMSVSFQQVEQALYQSQSSLLTIPREVFAVGAKPPIEKPLVEREEIG